VSGPDHEWPHPSDELLIMAKAIAGEGVRKLTLCIDLGQTYLTDSIIPGSSEGTGG
jgi:hypothetical protein